jgi:hypothetical protein
VKSQTIVLVYLSLSKNREMKRIVSQSSSSNYTKITDCICRECDAKYRKAKLAIYILLETLLSHGFTPREVNASGEEATFNVKNDDKISNLHSNKDKTYDILSFLKFYNANPFGIFPELKLYEATKALVLTLRIITCNEDNILLYLSRSCKNVETKNKVNIKNLYINLSSFISLPDYKTSNDRKIVIKDIALVSRYRYSLLVYILEEWYPCDHQIPRLDFMNTSILCQMLSYLSVI